MTEHEPAPNPQEDARYEVFVKKFAHFEADVRRFVRSLLPNWTDADEVVQQTAIVMWRKFDQYDPETHFMKWACVIARFEALAYRRKMARDRLVFREDVLELMADEGVEEIDQRDAEHAALESCMSDLPEKSRQLLTLAYTQGVKVKELAEEAGSSAEAFYMRLNRLRRQLMTCVESKLQQPGHA
ncbi:sigma-70 family RNA polymerase sigma factor [Prosthecobacter sp.]|uniref:sigma-70 family RNA polymerase sigma factor n=1 Tax=Prosthecobacter sp. TaxID=1965333 RepID=UPI002489372E|nr:sigma-70 family RNA polymerase sigma factor [Prosthecobacter sp.]MDI1310996.1 sigma-70 family RNA polymerase sigma factor [Prosthecobacter sp.]